MTRTDRGSRWRMVAAAAALALSAQLPGCGHPTGAVGPPAGPPPPALGAPARRADDEASTPVWGVDANGLGSIAVSKGRLFVGLEQSVRAFKDGVETRRVAWPRHEVEVDIGRIAALSGQVYFYFGRGQYHTIQRIDVDTGAPPTTFLELPDEMGDIAADENALAVTMNGSVTVAPLPAGPAWTATFPDEHTRHVTLDPTYVYVSVGHALWRVNRRDRTQTQLATTEGRSRLIEAVVSDGTTVYFFVTRDWNDRATRPVLMRVPANGGAATRVTELPVDVYSAAFANGVLYAAQQSSVIAIDAATGRIDTVDAGWAYPTRLVVDGNFLYYVSKSAVRRVGLKRRLGEDKLRLPSCTPVAEAPEGAPAVSVGTTASGHVGLIKSDATGLYWTEPEAGRIMRVARPGPAGATVAAPPTVVADHQAHPSALALGGGRVYWIAGKHDITRVALAGGRPEVIWQAKPVAHELAVRGDVVYWLEETPDHNGALMELAAGAGHPRELMQVPPVADMMADGDSIFLALGRGGLVRYDTPSARARILAGTDFVEDLSVAGSFVYWASPRETAAYRVDRDGGVPQELLLSPRVHRRDVTVTAISVEGNRAVWIARDDFNEPRISEGDLSGTCARINWSTVDGSATSAYVDDTGAYWSAGDRVMAKPTAIK